MCAAPRKSLYTRITNRVHRRHSFVVGAIIGSQAAVGLVSNYESFTKGQIQRQPSADDILTISQVKPKSATLFVTGESGAVLPHERQKLELTLRSGASAARIQDLLHEVNVAVSLRVTTVSAGCFVASIDAAGTSSSQPFLTAEQRGDFIPPDTAKLLKDLGLRLNPAIGPDGRPKPIRLVQEVSSKIEMSERYFREQFKLRPDNSELWNNYGSFLISRRKTTAAIAAFRKSLGLQPNNTTAMANLAKNLWLGGGDISEADHLYSNALAIMEPSVPSWILSDFALLREELGDTERAQQLHARAALDRDYPLALARQALFMLIRENNTEGARYSLQQALERQSNNADILVLAGHAEWFYLGDREGALDKLQKACVLAQHNTFALKLCADFSLCLGAAASAIGYYRRALKDGASRQEIAGNYGLALLLDRKAQLALRELSGASSPRQRILQSRQTWLPRCMSSGEQTRHAD